MKNEKFFRDNHCLIIGEIAQTHDGSLGTCHAYIDAIAKAGADAIKFQTHIADAESTPIEPWRIKFSPQDETRYEYWKRMEFTEDQWLGLKQHCDEKGLMFLSSPFSIEACELLMRVGIPVWKVASGEVTNNQMLEYMIASKLPIILSSGMSPISEIDQNIGKISEAGNLYALLQCTSMYPCPPEKLGLNMIPYFMERYGCPVGISDHSGTIFGGLAAATLGAAVIEVHVVFSSEVFGPDVVASITTSQLTDLVQGVRFIQQAMSHPVDKGALAEELDPMRALFTKSIVAARDISAGEILDKSMVLLKKPGTGIPADKLPGLLGRRVKTIIPKNKLFEESDFE